MWGDNTVQNYHIALFTAVLCLFTGPSSQRVKTSHTYKSFISNSYFSSNWISYACRGGTLFESENKRGVQSSKIDEILVEAVVGERRGWRG
jgi:hypothetical protein